MHVKPLDWEVAYRNKVRVYMRRDDLIHPHISGNKLYKLWGHLHRYFEAKNPGPIASFGGAYSNHLHALAALGETLGLETVGIIRGERPLKLSPTLRDLEMFGMRLHFLSRSAYQNKHEPFFRESLAQTLGLPPNTLWIPEGGGGDSGREGCIVLGQVLSKIDMNCCIMACGTGTTLAGVAEGLQRSEKCARLPTLGGISALSSDDEHFRLMVNTQNPRLRPLNWFLTNQFHCGGYARVNVLLQSFMSDFQSETTISLDRVYTGKMMLGLKTMIENKFFRAGDKICVIHSGGLQGNRKLSE